MEIREENRKFKISKSSEETKEDFYFELRNVTYLKIKMHLTMITKHSTTNNK